MTPQLMEFIDRLSIEDKYLLKSLLEQDIMDAKNYLSFLLLEDSFLNEKTSENIHEKIDTTLEAIELTKDIPMYYLPIIGMKDLYHNICPIYDYLHMNVFEKRRELRSSQYKVEICDYASQFLIDHLNERIVFCKEKHKTVSSGRELLDDHLKEKINLVLSIKEEIYKFLRCTGDNYVFIGNPRGHYLDNLVSGNNFENLEELVTILARYSHLEDLKNHNIESFQKFIKPENY